MRRLHTLTRLIELWRVYAYLDFMWMTRDVRYFLINVVSDLILNLAGVTAVFLLAERFDGIGEWTVTQMVFLLGYATAVTGALDMCFTYNVLHISRRLGRGQLDHTLIQPQPVWMALLTEGFAPFSGSGTLITGLGVMAWATARLPLTVTPGWTAAVAVNLGASCAIVLAFSFLWGSLAFWAPRGAEEISSAAVRLIYQLKSFPFDGVGPALQGGLLTVLPVGFVAWYPCGHLLEMRAFEYGFLVTPLVAVFFVVLVVWIFKRGMRHYGQTGSQRYLLFGHRR